MAAHLMRVESKCASTTTGELFVMISGTQGKPQLSADSLISLMVNLFVLFFFGVSIHQASVHSVASDNPGNAVALPRAVFGSGIGVIWFDDMKCLGNETNLLNCPHRGLGISNCAHAEDANVLCPGKMVSDLAS